MYDDGPGGSGVTYAMTAIGGYFNDDTLRALRRARRVRVTSEGE